MGTDLVKALRRSERLMERATDLVRPARPSREDLAVAFGLLSQAWRVDHDAFDEAIEGLRRAGRPEPRGRRR